jgi:hypothetical protein
MGLKNCEATRTSIWRIEFSKVLFTFNPILIYKAFLPKALMRVVVPILFKVKSF